MRSKQTWHRVRPLKTRRLRTPTEPPGPPPIRFVRVLAMFAGNCGICGASYNIGDPIYWCGETQKTRAMRCHEHCYLARTRGHGPSHKPSPTEGELKQQRSEDR
jgi:hypothetical protein